MVQMQEDPEALQPIENACVEWKTPWKKVATIRRIKKQVFDSKERDEFCEHLSFRHGIVLKNINFH